MLVDHRESVGIGGKNCAPPAGIGVPRVALTFESPHCTLAELLEPADMLSQRAVPLAATFTAIPEPVTCAGDVRTTFPPCADTGAWPIVAISSATVARIEITRFIQPPNKGAQTVWLPPPRLPTCLRPE